MIVRDLMQPHVVTLDVDEPLDVADGLMRLGRIRHVPVVDGERLVGIVSQRDLFRAGISSLLQLRGESQREWLALITLREIMTTRVFSVGPDVGIADALQLMLDKRIGCLPVVEDGRVVGILSETDCLQHLADLLGARRATAAMPDATQ